MAAQAAALLDELMGRNRNIMPNEKPRDLNWSDPDVCRHHLCAFCPHDLFVNTKADLGPCSKIHSDEFAKSYRQSGRYMKVGYEDEFLRYLEGLVSEVERRIKRGQERLALNAAHQAEKMQGVTQAQDERIAVLTKEINELVQKAEGQGCEGSVDEAKATMMLCEQKQEEKQGLENSKGNLQNPNMQKEMEVCQVCGAFLMVGDAAERVEEHLHGKLHIGYARIREAMEDVRKKLRGENPEKEAWLKKDREEREGRRKEREVEEEKGRSRKRSRSRSRKRSRSRDKRRRTEGRRDRDGSNERKRDRDGEKRRRSMREDRHDKSRESRR